MLRTTRLLGWMLVAALAAAMPAAAQAKQNKRGEMERVAPITFGEPFPLGSEANLNPDAGGSVVNLKAHRGEQHVLLYYWIAGNVRSEKMFKELETFVAERGNGQLALYGVVTQQPGREADLIRARLKEHGLTSPVIDDQGFRFGQRLRVRSVPNISLIDKDGVLRFTNGGSLRQTLERDMDLAAALDRAADGKSVGTYGYLDLYEPVEELVGQRCPTFQAPLLSGSEGDLHALLDSEKLNVFIYWSVECGHCRKYLPEFSDWLKENPGAVHVVTAAAAPNEAVRIKTREFCTLKEIDIPILLDKDHMIGDLYQITTTPTVLLIRPDGVVQSVLSSTDDFRTAIESARAQLAAGGS